MTLLTERIAAGPEPEIVLKTQRGHEIRFDDANEQVIIEDRAGRSRITIRLADNAITIDSLGDLRLRAEGKVEIEGKQGVSLTTPGEMRLAAQGAAALTSEETLDLQAPLMRLN